MEKKLESLLKLAISRNASDIHFDVKDAEMKVELRINGLLSRVSADYEDPKLLHYIRYLANLDIANSLKPETGSFETLVEDQIYSLRFAYIKNGFTENGVLRILNSNNNLKVEDLSPYKGDINFLKDVIGRENGLILMAGATGSGKTTSMYTLLKSVKDRKIYTVEDPIEVYSKDYVQLQINEAAGFDYNAAIKQIMRHDPDIIMIGEIRDEVAAKAAVRAANTGHLVISSIHASSTNLAINRMIDLGVDKNNLADVLIGVTYQKLFHRTKGGKVSIYERMDEEELAFYFKNGVHSEKFIKIAVKEDFCRKNKIIDSSK